MLIEKSEKFGAVCAALAKAQGEFGEIERNCEGQAGNRRFTYADFAAIRAAVIGPLTKNGLALFSGFAVELVDGGTVVKVQTELVHGDSGEWLRTPAVELDVAQGTDPKTIGGLPTYFRRYQARTLLGIADEEADGEGERIATARTAAPPAANGPANGARFRCQHGHPHTTAQGAKDCKDAAATPEDGAPPAPADRTLEPGHDPKSMGGDLTPAMICQRAIASKDWASFLRIIDQVKGAEGDRLRNAYNAARYPRKA